MEMNEQVANYARGKVIEILIVGAGQLLLLCLASWGLNYAALLGLLVGLVCDHSLHRRDDGDRAGLP